MMKKVRALEDDSDALCYYILTETATVLSRTLVQNITKEAFDTAEMQERVKQYHEFLNKHIDSASEYVRQRSMLILSLTTWLCQSDTKRTRAGTLDCQERLILVK